MIDTLTIHALKVSDEEFEQIVRANESWKFEQTAEGELVVVAPTGGSSGWRNLDLLTQFGAWVKRNSEFGKGFDSSTLFVLPNGAKRSPDASWVTQKRWDSLTPKQQDGYPPLCPDFVVELRSPTDSIQELRVKMHEYMKNGARLGWLIDPQDRSVEIYRIGIDVEVLQSPATLSGEDVLPGFVLDLRGIF